MTLSESFHKEFEFAKNTIRRAGGITLKYYKTDLKKIKKKDNTIATNADVAVEEFLKNTFRKQFPEYGFVGEETRQKEKNRSWIVDPIDGTVAFFRKIEEFANVIAFQVNGRVKFSVIYRPYSNDLFSAYEKKGAFKNETRISCSSTPSLSDALFSLDSGNMFRGHYHDAIMDIVNQYRVRVGHSAAIESSYMASGSVDVLSKFHQPIWDVAAEWLLMKEAGVNIYNETGDELILDFSPEARHNYIAVTNSIKKQELTSLFLSENT